MKKTIHIHLGGMPFTIDEDAFQLLSQYIDKLKSRFTNLTEQKEIMEDIEARMAEVFSSKINKTKQVIVIEDVTAVIEQLGHPEEIGEVTENITEPFSKNSENESNTTDPQHPASKGVKKLFRDEENKVLGGVIAGLCHYFGFDGVIWARLVFVVLLWMSFGTAILIYFILWLLVPKAVTYADKLQMRGEPVTLDAIEKEVKSAVAKFGEHLDGAGSNSLLTKVMHLGKVLLIGFLKIMSVIVFLISIFFLIAYVSMAFGMSFIGTGHLQEYLHLFFENTSVYWVSVLLALFAFGIPLFWVMYSSASFLFSSKIKSPRWLIVSSFVLWMIAVVGGSLMKINFFSKFKASEFTTEKLAIVQPSSSTFYITPKEDNKSFTDRPKIEIEDDNFDFVMHDNFFEKTENGFLIGAASIELKPSQDHQFHVVRKISARGNDKMMAKKNCNSVITSASVQSDSIIKLQSVVEINKKAAYRKQAITYVIYVPRDKKVQISNDAFEIEDKFEDSTPKNGQSYLEFQNVAGEIVSLNNENDTEVAVNKEGDDEENMGGQSIVINDSIVNITNNNKKVQININSKGVTIK